MLLKEDMVMRFVDFAPFNRSSIGFDRLFHLMENATQAEQAEAYPPYKIAKTGEDTYRITIAVAGFDQDELSITSQPNQLIVAGRKAQGDEGDYLYQGIAARAFQRQFSLADYVSVTNASLRNGLLSIDLVRQVPEAVKPRRIDIGNSNQTKIETQKAA
jgi:molecular chaperone IbpA